MSASLQNLPDAFSSFPGDREWAARWIAPAPSEPDSTRWLFRHDVTVTKREGTTLFISATGEYELWINGQRITTGPPPSQAFWRYYDQIDLTPWLSEGVNCLGAVLRHTGENPALLAEMVAADGTVLLQTGTDWRMTSRHGWQAGNGRDVSNGPRQEIFDMELHPEGWNLAGFDDSAWAQAGVPAYDPHNNHVFPGAYRMVPRDIPMLEEGRVLPQAVVAVEEGQEIMSRSRAESLSVQLSAAGQPVTYAAADNVNSLLTDEGTASFCCSLVHLEDRAFDGIWCPNVVLDFGKVYSGYLDIDIDAPAGTVVEIGYVERLLNGHFNNAVEVPHADQITLSGGRRTFRCSIWKSFRYAKLRFTRCFEPVSVHAVHALPCGYPFAEEGSFEADDETLVKAFEISRHTIRLCARDYLMDGPWREKIQWVGDVAAVTLGGIYACFGDAALPGKFLRQSMTCAHPHGLLANNSHSHSLWGHPHFIPDYNLWWIQGLWQHYLYTGDERFVHEGHPVVSRIVQFFFHYLNRHGLLDGVPGWIFYDHTFKNKPRELAVLSAQFYGTLESVRKIADLVGDQWLSNRAGMVRETMGANFHSRYFDPDAGVYVDGWTDGDPVRSVSEHTNMGAILWGLCPDDLVSDIIERFYVRRNADFLEAQPFGTAIVLRALAKARRMDLAMDIIRDRWGKRMIDRGMTSTTEEWNASGSWRGKAGEYTGIYRSLSHAWSACPAEFLTRNVIGLEILEPGCGKIRINPADAPQNYRVVFPTPHGPVEVEQSGDELVVSVPDEIELC